jgi:hypothetical protein
VTICVDFDGVVHGYSRGYQGGAIYDPPVPGAIEALKSLRTLEPVVICTAREDLRAVAEWLDSHGVPTVVDGVLSRPHFWNGRGEILVTNRKLPARVYVDDRALLFTGSWPDTLARIEAQPLHAPVVDPLAATRAVVEQLHPKDELGFCATCFGAYDAYDDQHARFLHPCPTLRAFKLIGE